MLHYGAFEMQSKSVLLGSIVHSLSFGEIEIIDNGMIIYSHSGVIDQIINLDKVSFDRSQLKLFKYVADYTGKLILPGFVDAHCHAPQYVFSGTGMDLPLLAWLEKYTFPCEARFADANFARLSYEKSIRRHLKCGTTFAAYFATIHITGGKALVDVINKVGQRAFVGKVSMDRNSPDFYIEETQRGCELAEEFARYVLGSTPIGAAFLKSVDTHKPITTGMLLAHSRLGRNNNRFSFGSSNRQNSGSSGSGSSGVAGITPTSSGSKRPRSVSDVSESDFPSPGHSRSQSQPLPVATITDEAEADTPDPYRPRAISDMDMYGELGEDFDFAAPDNHASSSATSSSSSSSSSAGASAVPSAQCYAAYVTEAVANGSMDEVITSLLNQPYTPRVLPCITPRFVPTCTGEMLASLGNIATKYGLPVQSHLSESVNEIAWVKELHPDCENYAAVYHKYGLLNERCIMGHCCHSDERERQMLATHRTSIVHCANSNFSLDSGVLNVHGCIAQGIKVGLGTDVAGGYSPSMLDALRQSILASKVIMFESRGNLGGTIPAKNSASSNVSQPSGGVEDNAVALSQAPVAEQSATETDSNHCSSPPTASSSSVPQSMSQTTTAEDCSDALMTDSTAAAITATTAESALDFALNPTPNAVEVSKTRSSAKTRTLTYKEAFHLATMGGALALGMDKVVGNFLPGKKLDCLIIDPAVANGPFDLFAGEGTLEFFQKFLYLGDDRNIVAVYVDGRQVI